MKIITDKKELQNITKNTTQTIGFVPTMGALHEGHISLIKKAREENELVIVSIFVNPTQFLAGEDFDKYPKRDIADKKICELAGVDIVFMPNIAMMYGDDEVTIKAPNIRGFVLDGFKRPGHFDGVLQIVLKLFNLVRPTNAYFGRKDAQQVILIKQMVENLFLPINVVDCPLIRDSNGLALSSRNAYLSVKQKEEALKISRSLQNATKLIVAGNLKINEIKKAMMETLEGIDVEYIEIVSRELLNLEQIELKNTIILVAVKIGTTRLIDNIWI
jgi:pantoate--beta-alanine ligase